MRCLYEWLFEFPGHKINPIFLFWILPALLILAAVGTGLYFWLN
jgi:hypothetical protein